MSVSLDNFSLLRAPKQARDIHRLVLDEIDWLRESFPDTVKRYEDVRKAVKNVARLAISEGINAYIIRKDKVAKGLATIIFDQTVLHPIAGRVDGNDLDYWLAKDADEELHNQTAACLLEENDRVSGRHHMYTSYDPVMGNRPDVQRIIPVMAAVKVGQPYPPIGLTESLSAVGEPSPLKTPDGGDPFGVTKGGTVLQLYRRV